MLPTSEPPCTDPCDRDRTSGERRGARRYVVSWGSFCRLRPFPESHSQRVLLHDISARGIGLVLAEAPRIGTVLALQLPAGRSGAARWAAAEVRQVVCLAERIWVAGCVFAEPLSREDVEDVLNSAPDSP